MTAIKVRSQIEKEQEAAMLLASIHAGVPGLSIRAPVMDFYKATVNGDSLRPRMLRIVVPLIRDEIMAGRNTRAGIEAKATAALVADARRLNQTHLKKWHASARAPFKSSGGNALDALRAAYVIEGLQVLEDAIQYVHALANEL